MKQTARGRPRRRSGRRGKLADGLRSVRRSHGWTQERAAVELGVSRVTLARWETGSHRPRGFALRLLLRWIEEAA